MSRKSLIEQIALVAALGLGLAGCQAPEPEAPSTASASRAAASAVPADPELGMGNELGAATWARCAAELTKPGAKAYELSHARSATMPLSPFAGPFEPTFMPSNGLPGTNQIFNMEVYNENANPGQQGTQIDAFGHFGYLDGTWDGSEDFSADGARYFGGLTQQDVKPTPDSPLLKLGIESIPPIVTSAILLDARQHVNGGKPMEAGQTITPENIEAMLTAEGLDGRGILPGDVVLIYTGWSDHYRDPAGADTPYYGMAPGLSYDAAKYLSQRRVVAAGLDTPFVDAVAEGQLTGAAPPPPGTPAGMAFPVHFHFLAEAGVHTLENLNLKALAEAGVTTSCTMVLPALEKGAAGAAIRPVAIGVPTS